MNISEKDIFDYVYYRDQLQPDKIIYIEKTYDLFSETIEYYKSFQNKLDYETDSKIMNKFFSEISGNMTVNIELFPKQIEFSEVNENLKLAAESVKLKVSPVSQTFFDKNSYFMVRFVANKGKTLIYVFSTDDKRLRNINLTLTPSGKTYSMENNLSYLEVEGELTAERIEMSFEADK